MKASIKPGAIHHGLHLALIEESAEIRREHELIISSDPILPAG